MGVRPVDPTLPLRTWAVLPTCPHNLRDVAEPLPSGIPPFPPGTAQQRPLGGLWEREVMGAASESLIVTFYEEVGCALGNFRLACVLAGILE